MIGLIVAVLIIIAIGSIILGAYLSWDKANDTVVIKRGIGFFILALFIFFGSIILGLSAKEVPAGNRGVVLTFGAVNTNTALSEGLHFINPFTDSLVLMSVQNQKYETIAAAASYDLQDVATNITLNYNLEPNKVPLVYQTMRGDYESRVIQPAVQEAVKSITAKFNAEELITKRPEVKDAITTVLSQRLSPQGIIVDAVSITDFKFSPTFTNAIEAKVVAVQQALQSQNKLAQIQWEAQQQIATANGTAMSQIAKAEGERQSKILSAQGDANATLTIAQAQANANLLVSPTITQQIIQYAYVQRLADGMKVMILPNGQQFILSQDMFNNSTNTTVSGNVTK